MSVQQALAGDAPAPPTATAARRRALGAIVLVLACLGLFWPTTSSLIERWQSDLTGSYDHGYLMVAMVLWLFWRNREALVRVDAGSSALAWGALLAACLCWLVVYRAGLQILHQSLLPMIIFLAFVGCFGLRAWRAGLPVLYLYFAVPLWDGLNPVLQQVSVWAVELLLAVIGVPVYFTGNTLTMPVGAFEIADGCSGLRFFIIGVAVAALYGELNRDTPWTRVKLCVLAAVLSMLMNWVRIVIIVIAGYLTDMQHYLVSEEHISFGWVIFAVTMGMFFLIVRRWPLPPASEELAAGVAPGRQVQPAAIAVTVAVLLLVPAWSLLDKNHNELTDVAQVLPARLDGWTVKEAATVDWQPVFIGADAREQVVFSVDQQRLEAFAAIYLDQHQGKELIAYGNSVTGDSLRALRRSHGGGVWAEVQAADYAGGHWLIWSAYRLDEHWYGRGLALQMRYGVGSLFGAPVSEAIAVRAACAGEDCTQARAALNEFTATVWPQSVAGGG